jgi:hypothetical protein
MRNIKIVLAVVCFIVFVFLLNKAGHSIASDNTEHVQAAAVVAKVPPMNAELYPVKLTTKELIASCGEPTRTTFKVTGRGKTEEDTWHLWYSKVPAEVIIAGIPWDGNPRNGQWGYAGASPSLASNDMYDDSKIAKKMPCLAKWANAEQALLDKELKN